MWKRYHSIPERCRDWHFKSGKNCWSSFICKAFDNNSHMQHVKSGGFWRWLSSKPNCSVEWHAGKTSHEEAGKLKIDKKLQLSWKLCFVRPAPPTTPTVFIYIGTVNNNRWSLNRKLKKVWKWKMNFFAIFPMIFHFCLPSLTVACSFSFSISSPRKKKKTFE